jgi:hypothetical protein
MILIIKIAALSFLFVTAEPLILLKRFCGFKDEDYMKFNKTKAFIHRLINCCLCSGFWIGLILTGSIYDAALISIISEIIYKINNRL